MKVPNKVPTFLNIIVGTKYHLVYHLQHQRYLIQKHILIHVFKCNVRRLDEFLGKKSSHNFDFLKKSLKK